MPSIAFTTASGETVRFKSKPKRKKPSSQLTPYQRHVRKAFRDAKKSMPGEWPKEKSQKIMKAAARAWKKKSSGKKKKKSSKKKKTSRGRK